MADSARLLFLVDFKSLMILLMNIKDEHAGNVEERNNSDTKDLCYITFKRTLMIYHLKP